ncbi:hypothetical protein [Roseomonas chloroacetimidivorans]|uniref:hypothetical protein n=1 Tax=Roseomonas chloroacetimidivorans TaxID=1766656 RepID=UPI003C756130
MSDPLPLPAPGVLHTLSNDAPLSPATPPAEALRKALRLVWRVGRTWALDDVQLYKLLGDPDGAMIPIWFRSHAPVLAPNSLRRIGLLVALRRLLRRRDPRPSQDLEWLTTPHPQLDRRPPLDRLLAGGLDDLRAVHAVLTAEVAVAVAEGSRRRPRLTPLGLSLRRALRRLCDVERGGVTPTFPTSPPTIAFSTWSEVERWVWDGDGDEDAPVRSRIAELMVQAGRVLGGDEMARRWLIEPQIWIGGDPPLVAAVTPGGAHRARGLLRTVETTRQRFRDAGILPDEEGDPGPSSPRQP